MGPLHEIRVLLAGRAPLVVLDTAEEERARDLVLRAAGDLDRPAFEWSVRSGLLQAAAAGGLNRQTAPPLDALEHIAGMRGDAVFLLKDLHPHLADLGWRGPSARRSPRAALAARRSS